MTTNGTAIRVCVVTGSRAEFGLLRPMIERLRAFPGVDVRVLGAGAHMLSPARTIREVESSVGVDARVDMQRDGDTGRLADAEALGRGIKGMARVFRDMAPSWVVVLGDRIEALAGATAASVGGIPVAHIHGGDRAEGVADESMRHAISKMAHLHLAATETSAERLRRMGEDDWRIHVVGSTAVEDFQSVEPLGDKEFGLLGEPMLLILLHPAGMGFAQEGDVAEAVGKGIEHTGGQVLWLAPNFDPDREAIDGVRRRASDKCRVKLAEHLPHDVFRGLLRRLSDDGGVLVGNSSAGLIEASAFRCPAVDIGARQGGRERPANVVHVDEPSPMAVARAIEDARRLEREGLTHPYGDGRASERIADLIAQTEARDLRLLRKRCTY